MKVLTFSRHFPKGHPKEGQATCFVEKTLRTLSIPDYWDKFYEWNEEKPIELLKEFASKFYYPTIGEKHHTIRSGSRLKADDMASLRVWSGAPYRSKQIEFAQVEVKHTWDIEIYATGFILEMKVSGVLLDKEGQERVALNDGLNLIDFYNWFKIHPKKTGLRFTGQIISWSDKPDYP
jgi:hypothetical protein